MTTTLTRDKTVKEEAVEVELKSSPETTLTRDKTIRADVEAIKLESSPEVRPGRKSVTAKG